MGSVTNLYIESEGKDVFNPEHWGLEVRFGPVPHATQVWQCGRPSVWAPTSRLEPALRLWPGTRLQQQQVAALPTLFPHSFSSLMPGQGPSPPHPALFMQKGHLSCYRELCLDFHERVRKPGGCIK